MVVEHAPQRLPGGKRGAHRVFALQLLASEPDDLVDRVLRNCDDAVAIPNDQVARRDLDTRTGDHNVVRCDRHTPLRIARRCTDAEGCKAHRAELLRVAHGSVANHTDRTAGRRTGGEQLAPNRGLSTGTDNNDGAQTNRINSCNLTRVRVAGVAWLVAGMQRVSRSDETHARLERDHARVEYLVAEAQPIKAVRGQRGTQHSQRCVDGCCHRSIVSP